MIIEKREIVVEKFYVGDLSFDTNEEAQNYVNKTEKQITEIENWISQNLKMISDLGGLQSYGTWKISGADPNCDLGGYHHQPHLDTVESTLLQAIQHAFTFNEWYSWGGAAGSISKVNVKKL